MGRALREAMAGALLLGLLGCQSGEEGEPDGARPDVPVEAGADAPDADGGTSSEPDGPTGPASGPATLIATEAGFVEDRLCDLDQDGVLDNAIADLGQPASTVLTSTLNMFLEARLEEGRRVGMFLPWVDDLLGPNDPETDIVFFYGLDTDDPVDPTDDFSGEEPYHVRADELDGCGEPAYVFPRARLDDGEIVADSGVLPMMILEQVEGELAAGQQATIRGSMEPQMRGGVFEFCMFLGIGDLGGLEGTDMTEDAGDLTVLEAFLVGGAAYGVPAVPGISPDVDMDGDGLERVEVDADGHIVQCIDGDRTVISGRDCSQDPRIADGFSMNLRLHATSARMAGRQPGWEELVVGECPGGPPETSVFDVD